jgi:hypothetical protein
MPDLEPHPLVLSVALTLTQQDVGTLQADAVEPLLASLPRAVQAAAQAKTDAADDTAARQDAAEELDKAIGKVKDSQWADAWAQADDDAKRNLATAFANQATAPALNLFAGYLGGPVDHDGLWRLLYLDARLCDWMLVADDDIVSYQQVKDENAPGEYRDVLWVKSTANVISGTGARANDGRFLVGSLTRAGDFAPSTAGGTFSAASGLVCEATTPPCCYTTRTRC